MRSESAVVADRLSVRSIAERPADPWAVPVLAGVDPLELDPEERVLLIQGLERATAMVVALQQRALAAVVDQTEALGLPGEDARHEVGAALRLAPGTAAERTRVACELRDRLPTTLAALSRGDICWRQAADLAEGVRGLSDAHAAAVEARVLPRMDHQTAAETRRAVRDAIVVVDPAGEQRRHQQAHRERRIERLPQPHGMASWWVPLPADVEADLWAALTTRATAARAAHDAAGRDHDGLDALRVDALVAAVFGADPATPGPAVSTDGSTDGSADIHAAARLPRCSCGGRQTAAVVLDLPTALGLADNPGRLPGYGAVPGPLARRMAADRDWVRWTVDPGTGHLLDRGATTYRPSNRLRAFILARDRVCGFPGCNRRAEGCDCDHVIVFGARGQTRAVNLGPLCRQHHNAKTHGRWRLHYDPTTRVKTWTSPLGRQYTKTTEPMLM